MNTLLFDLESSLDSALVNGSILNTSILDTIKTMENSILSIGIGLVTIRNNKLYEGLGFKNMSAYVLYLVKESHRDRSSIYKWLQIGEIYLKYREELIKIGFTSKDGLTKLPYLERALQNKPYKEVYDNLIKMKQREFSNYARSISEDNFVIEGNTKAEIEETEEEWRYVYSYRGKEAVWVNKKIGKNALRIVLSAIRLAFNVLERRTYVWAVHLDNPKEWKLFKPIITKAREELQKKY